MINLTDTQFGQKRKVIWAGLNSFDLLSSNSLNMVYYVQIIDDQGNLIDDKSIFQNRRLVYPVGNQKKVDANFNLLNEGDPGYEIAQTEFEYVTALAATTPLPTIGQQLAIKLNQRGYFD